MWRTRYGSGSTLSLSPRPAENPLLGSRRALILLGVAFLLVPQAVLAAASRVQADLPVILDVEPPVPMEDVIDVYDLCREIVENDASHAGARRVLGFVRFRDGWVTPFDAELLRRGFVWTEQWGWIRWQQGGKSVCWERTINFKAPCRHIMT